MRGILTMSDFENTTTANSMEEIKEVFRKHLTRQYTTGVSIGTKIGAEFVRNELGNPEDWVKLDADGLMELLTRGVAKAEEIKNAGPGSKLNNKTDDEVTEGTI